jgi:ribosomal protein L12E/L44/L45/RPP1/RPP2
LEKIVIDKTHPNPAVVKQLVEALKAAGLFVHHCWCDVSMNEYSSKKLDETMEKIDSALAAAKEAGL